MKKYKRHTLTLIVLITIIGLSIALSRLSALGGKILFVIIPILVIVFIIYLANKNSNKNFNTPPNHSNINDNNDYDPFFDTKSDDVVKYTARNSLVTECEKGFYDKLKAIVQNRYLVLPQIPLSSLVKKLPETKYANELFRTIDFGIFDNNFKPLVLIEINDSTHNTKQRIIRDDKVKDILESANLPLICLWTKYDNTIDYIKNRLTVYLDL